MTSFGLPESKGRAAGLLPQEEGGAAMGRLGKEGGGSSKPSWITDAWSPHSEVNPLWYLLSNVN